MIDIKKLYLIAKYYSKLKSAKIIEKSMIFAFD